MESDAATTTAVKSGGKATIFMTILQPSVMELGMEGSLQLTETSLEPAPYPTDGPVIASQDVYQYPK